MVWLSSHQKGISARCSSALLEMVPPSVRKGPDALLRTALPQRCPRLPETRVCSSLRVCLARRKDDHSCMLVITKRTDTPPQEGCWAPTSPGRSTKAMPPRLQAAAPCQSGFPSPWWSPAWWATRWLSPWRTYPTGKRRIKGRGRSCFASDLWRWRTCLDSFWQAQ